ncbi:hypothetical protein Rs2_05248 [Raphanus sativus]|nr:hypothetical protein Rs2_05248 [Raphanus sativus]
MSVTGDRLLILPTPPRASFISTPRFSRLPLNRPRTGCITSVNRFRVLPLSRQWNPIVSTRRRLFPVRAIDSDLPHQNKEYEEWDSWTAKFSGGANAPFLMLQLPQIILNSQNLLAGNNTALSAVPWLGMLTGLLGNLSLLSYFAKKREKEAAVVQTLGVVSTYVVLVQLTIAGAMPVECFAATSSVVAVGLVLNCLFCFGKIGTAVWGLWEDFITVGGLSVLPQIMWSTFVPMVPNSILPGTTAFVIAVAAVIMARTGKLPEEGVRFVGLYLDGQRHLCSCGCQFPKCGQTFKPRQHKRLITNHNGTCDDGERAYDPTSAIYPRSDVVHRFNMGDSLLWIWKHSVLIHVKLHQQVILCGGHDCFDLMDRTCFVERCNSLWSQLAV